MTSHANIARMFNATHLQVGLGVATTKGPHWAYNIFLSMQELQCSLGEPSVLLSVCLASSSKPQPAFTKVNRDTPIDLELD